MPSRGRPSPWQNRTKMIRLPEPLEPELITLAHALEAGAQLITLEQLQEARRAVLRKMRPSDRRSALKAFRRLEAELTPAAQSGPTTK